jgi:hypothetical protein
MFVDSYETGFSSNTSSDRYSVIDERKKLTIEEMNRRVSSSTVLDVANVDIAMIWWETSRASWD